MNGDIAPVEAEGIEAAADWAAVRTPETYLGYERGEHFASPGRAALGERHAYETRLPLRLNHWALSGDWTIDRKAVRSHDAEGRLTFHFSARDVNLVMGPAEGEGPIPFRVRLDGSEPGEASGADIDERGDGLAENRRLYQLVRQPGAVDDRVFEITFLTLGAEAYVFTCG